MSLHILSMAFSHDNQAAFISDMDGNINIIKQQAIADSGDEFDCTEKSKKIGKGLISSICLTKDDKYLLVGSGYLVSILETTTIKVKKNSS